MRQDGGVDGGAGEGVSEEALEPDRLGWRNSHKDPPAGGQEVYYFGPDIGIGIGHYKYEEQVIKSKKGHPDVHLCPHIFTNNEFGVVDACDAPRWQPYDAKRAKSWVPIPPVEYLQEIMENLSSQK
jgi:hypothetical protein